MRSMRPLGIAGTAVGITLLAACSCPTSYRDVPAPHVRSTPDVQALTRCQIQHYGPSLLGRANSAAMVHSLLKRGAKVQGRLIINGKQMAGTPLNLAVSAEVIQALTAAGCDPNVQGGPDKSTPLCSAVRNKRRDAVAALLAAGANPDLADSRGVPPLCIAAAQGDIGICDQLLRSGAKVNLTDRETGNSPLMALLLSGNGIESQTETKQTIAQKLLGAGADPLLPNLAGTLPLHMAPACLVPSLLAAGADVNCRDATGRTPLFYGGSQPRLELLLQCGADMNVRDLEGNSAFDTVPEASLKSYLLFRGCRSGKAL